MKPISQLVVEASWVSFRSLPPKEAMVALVVTDMIRIMQRLGKPISDVDLFSSMGMTLSVEMRRWFRRDLEVRESKPLPDMGIESSDPWRCEH